MKDVDRILELEAQVQALREAMRLARNTYLEEAYLIARGGSRFKELGTKQLYWKGRCDAATEIRKAKSKP